MPIINKDIFVTPKKKIPMRILEVINPKYIFITHHGMLSNKTSWRYLEKWIQDKAIVINYDARVNGNNTLRPSRLSKTYAKDLRDIVRWTKKKYPNIKIVTLGSSWGATVVINFAKRYGDEAFKNIAWSIPYNFTKSEDAKEINDNNDTIENKVKTTGTWGYAYKFMLMLFLNINTKSYTKIDLNQTADNKLLQRLNTIQKAQATSTKLFWAAYKDIITANKKLKKISLKYKEEKLLYFQSTKDTYLKKNKLEQLAKINGDGVKLIFLDEGKHAFQWETKNDLNIRVFQMMWDWLESFK